MGDANRFLCREESRGSESVVKVGTSGERRTIASVRKGPAYFSPSFEISNASSFQNRNFIVLPVTFHIVDVGRTHLVHYRPSYEIENINLYYI